jgi:drug/metabolite transporter (DMT)-like permease
MDTYFSSGPAQLMLVIIALTLMVAGSLLCEFAWRIGNVPTPFIAFAQESLKLCVSIYFYNKEMKGLNLNPNLERLFTVKFWWASVYFAIPGGLYFIGNNLALIAYKYLSSHLVAMLANFKLLVSASLASIYLKQKFSMLQWVSLVLVVTGLVITMENPGKKKK